MIRFECTALRCYFNLQIFNYFACIRMTLWKKLECRVLLWLSCKHRRSFVGEMLVFDLIAGRSL